MGEVVVEEEVEGVVLDNHMIYHLYLLSDYNSKQMDLYNHLPSIHILRLSLPILKNS